MREIRSVTPEDAAPLAALMEDLGYPTSAAEMEQRLESIGAHPEYYTLVACEDGAVVGMIGLCRGLFYEKNGVYVRILALVVERGRRGQGTGTALVRAAEAWAERQGASAIFLNSGRHRSDAHAFYRRLGYEATGLRFSRLLR